MRELTDIEKRLKQVLTDTRGRMKVLTDELEIHKKFVEFGQKTCDHIWIGQDDIYPHGTPRETFICAICDAKEVR